MAKHDTRILGLSDAQILDSFRSAWVKLGEPDEATLQLQIGTQRAITISFPVAESKSHEMASVIRKAKSALLTRTTLSLPGVGLNAVVRRDDTGTYLEISHPDNQTPDTVLPLIAGVRSSFRRFDATQSVAAILGDELAEFYGKREETLARLEGLNEELIRSTDSYRAELDSRLATRERGLDEKFDARMSALEEQYVAKEGALTAKETDLAKRTNELDDRSNTHARRKLREDLKSILKERNTTFQLTKETQDKRKPIHILFIVMIVVLGAFAGDMVWDQFGQSGLPGWPGLLRATLAIFSFGASVAFYIKWNDLWARQHAEEEFRLRQLELDVDRASWVVEMALEWKEERGSQIPQELVDQLTRGLFERETRFAEVRHPTTDLADALLGASAGLTMTVPGLGEVALDRKGVRKFRKGVETGGGPAEG